MYLKPFSYIINFNMKIYDIETGSKQIIKLIKSYTDDFIILGIAGGSASGKGFLAKQILKEMNLTILSMDDYYKSTNDPNTNFDHPNSLDLELLAKHLVELQQGNTINKPIYDFVTHTRSGYEAFSSTKIVLLDGLFGLNELFIDKLSLSIFIKASETIRLKRRITRDIKERGRTKESVLKQWATTVQPMYSKHIEPQSKIADILIINN